jgi:citrate synthase
MSGNDNQTGAGKTFLSSSEVVQRLGISKSTLYAYVSRGLIRSEPVPGSPRTRRYRADDVERLLNRQRMRSDPEQAATTALTWGTPVLESTVSMIADGHLYYRDTDVIDLARSHRFEDAVSLLWFENLNQELPAPLPHSIAARQRLLRQTQTLASELDVPARVQMMLPALEQREAASYDFRSETVHRIGVDILQLYTAALAGAEGHSGIARTLQSHWAPGKHEIAELIDAALILSADHELNISTFTVRCVASARGPLHSAITAGLSAMRGQKHGGATLQAEALFREVESQGETYAVLRERLQRGETLAGFGHRLYPDGDPRGRALLEMLQERLPTNSETVRAIEIAEVAEQLQGLRPNIDFGLVALTRAIRRPPGTALALMAFGRIAGWVAHANEEYERDQLIRPRARYSEPEPDTE